ncbi:MAG: hypothetical protein BWY21_00991 [Parcubacteria group bacterium ADurb.Bin216]|nr:MAG: hypothetical protein BWY21_00991 [Parcubacteria group bacterium ADurb.Bin216]
MTNINKQEILLLLDKLHVEANEVFQTIREVEKARARLNSMDEIRGADELFMAAIDAYHQTRSKIKLCLN